MAALSFRPLTRDDLPLLHEWLQRPHVRRWWSSHPTLEDVTEKYAPEHDRLTERYVACSAGRPVAYLQTYLLASYPDYAKRVGAEPGAAGVDLFIADEAETGRGLGSELLRRFTDEVVWRNGTTHCVADPDVDNAASRRAFAKAGFRETGFFDDPEDKRPHVLVRKDRD